MAGAQLYIEVPFHQKDRAKELGARWDLDLKQWFVPYGQDLNKFKEWWPDVLKKQMAGLHDTKKEPRKKKNKARK